MFPPLLPLDHISQHIKRATTTTYAQVDPYWKSLERGDCSPSASLVAATDPESVALRGGPPTSTTSRHFVIDGLNRNHISLVLFVTTSIH